MSINVSNLILKLQQKISTADNEENLLFYAKALQQLRSGTINTVNFISELPQGSENKGKLFFVKSEIAVYWSAGENGSWTILGDSYPQLFLWGNNNCGKLGDGSIVPRCSPTREATLSTDWCRVSIDNIHSAALKTDGTIWSWGAGSLGRLGNGTVVDVCSPVQEISSSTNWSQLSAGSNRSVGIKADGTLWSWGSNNCGRLGDGTVADKSSPVQEFCSAADWCQIGNLKGPFSVAVKSNGTLWSWGLGTDGVLGDGTVVGKCSPVQEITSSTNWCQVSGGCNTTSAIKTDGTLWAWGSALCGLLGDGTTTNKSSPVQEISSSANWCQVSIGGSFHSSAIKTDGTLWSWGSGSALGDGTTVSKCSPVQEFCSATNWCQVAASGTNTSAIKTDGTLWSWGLNTCGRLGDGTVADRCSPVQEFCSATNWCQVAGGYNHIAAIAFVQT